ncbi:MAG: hypothetical protein ABSG55_00840 [Dehalococcoidia bacterium]
MKHGLNASPANAASIRAKLGKRVRRLVRLERQRRPWLGDDTDNLLRMLAERRIMKENLLIECDRKGILGTSGNESRRSKAIDKIDSMLITIERALPARPDVRGGGACNLDDPNFAMPPKCWLWLIDTVLADDQQVAPSTEGRQPTPEQQLIQEAESIISEGGQS